MNNRFQNRSIKGRISLFIVSCPIILCMTWLLVMGWSMNTSDFFWLPVIVTCFGFVVVSFCVYSLFTIFFSYLSFDGKQYKEIFRLTGKTKSIFIDDIRYYSIYQNSRSFVCFFHVELQDGKRVKFHYNQPDFDQIIEDKIIKNGAEKKNSIYFC